MSPARAPDRHERRGTIPGHPGRTRRKPRFPLLLGLPSRCADDPPPCHSRTVKLHRGVSRIERRGDGIPPKGRVRRVDGNPPEGGVPAATLPGLSRLRGCQGGLPDGECALRLVSSERGARGPERPTLADGRGIRRMRGVPPCASRRSSREYIRKLRRNGLPSARHGRHARDRRSPRPGPGRSPLGKRRCLHRHCRLVLETGGHNAFRR